MGLFSLGKKRARSLALIDIGSASVGGAFAHIESGKEPIIYYTARVNVELREGETVTDSMLRSLAFLERLLIEEGAPTLRRETGNGAVEQVVVSVAAPWQQTVVTTEHILERKPFTFTRTHLHNAAARVIPPAKDRIRSGQTVIATMLNGYETASPFGKRATRAEMIILASSIEKEAARGIEASLRRAFHRDAIELTAFAPVAYAAFRDLYPHQKDFVVLDVSGSGTDVAFVKQGHLTEVRAIAVGTHDIALGARTAASSSDEALADQPIDQFQVKEANGAKKAWLDGLHEAFSTFAGLQALPRTVFLLADPEAREYLKHVLEVSDLRALWLSDEPLSVIPVIPSHLAPKVKTRGLGEGDLFLALLALYCARKDEAPNTQP